MIRFSTVAMFTMSDNLVQIFSPRNLQILFSFAGIITTVVLLNMAFRQTRTITAGRRAVIFYLCTYLVWFILLVLPLDRIFPALPPSLVSQIPVYGVLLLSAEFLFMTRDYLRKPQLKKGWIVLTVLIYIMLIAMEVYSDLVAHYLFITNLLPLLLLGYWAIMNLGSLIEVISSYRNAAKPLHRNRIVLWIPVLIFELVGDSLILAGIMTAGLIIKIIGLLAFGYVVFTHPLPDIQNFQRRFLRYFLLSLTAAAYFVFGIFIYGIIRLAEPELNPIISSGLIILLVAISIKPVIVWVDNLLLRLIPEINPDTQTILREYSYRISKVLELEDLAIKVINQIDQTLEIEYGQLISLERDQTSDHPNYRLRGFSGLGETRFEPFVISADEPVCNYFLAHHKPLSQYEIDYLPEFKDTSAAVKNWLEEISMDLFVPITTRDELIGLIALGPKASKVPYTAPELDFLITLSDQTSIALENARLLNGLTRLNQEYRRAYTALEKSNQQLERAVRKLEKIDKVKSDFITVLSHELRTPMTLIQGYAQLLLDEPDIDGNPDWRQLVQGIDDGTCRLEDIISAMLDMATIDAQSLEVKIEPTNSAQMITNIVESLTEELGMRSIQVQIYSADELPLIETDPELLRKALYQLITNAIKYSPDGSEIQVNIHEPESSTNLLGEKAIEVTIVDRGIGIEQEQLELIFDKFYQTGEVALHSSGKTKYKGGGPGLGLAIVKGIINELQGQVWAESSGQDENSFPGSEFHILLPVKLESTSKSPNNQVMTFPLKEPPEKTSADNPQND